MANTNIANVKPPKSPNLPIPPTQYSQDYMNQFTDALRLYFNQVDILLRFAVTPTLGYYLDRPYIAVSDSTSQSILAANTPQAVTFNTTDLHDNTQGFNFQPDMFINPLDSSQIIIYFPSIYNIQFSMQVHSTSASAKTVYIWLAQNGVAVPNTASRFQISGSNEQVVAWNFLVETFQPGEFIQLMWQADSTTVEALAVPATATIPAIPSTILTITQASP